MNELLKPGSQRVRGSTPPLRLYCCVQERVRFDQALGLARSRLSKDDYEKAWDAGRSVSLDRILGMGVAAGPRTQA